MRREKGASRRPAAERGEIFDRRVGSIADLLSDMARRAEALPDKHKALLAEALEQLTTSLEELQVAGEELTQQGEELAASRQIGEVEKQRYVELFNSVPAAYLVTD